ncbi:transcription repressor OFP7-like [Telopea speciosissima]|uniref:transcription repressor OFP7-like n=1 Tax=Telopea speciosissima TaxID=54955 RepID=UPI001CC82AF1|nr:transcription repressor OFP7-like [Telopea speciosissima]
MAKRFKLRLFRLIPSFQNCRSKDPSVLPADPHPIFFRLSPTTTANSNKMDFPATPAALPVPDPPPPLPLQPTPKPYHSSLKRHVSSAILSVRCGFRSRSTKQHVSSDDNSDHPEYKWKQNDKWHVIAPVHDDPPAPRRKIHNSSVSSGTDADVSQSPLGADSKNKKRKKKKKSKPRIRISTSSGDSGWFSSEGGEDDGKDREETETLVSSSRSISTDYSTDFNPHLETINESPNENGSRHKKKKKKNHRRVRRLKPAGKGKTSSSPGTDTPPRLSVFQKLIPCTVDGKVRESFAVIKRSEHPYEDFKRSMLEMIVEKQMFEARELEQLLHCFLSLNSRQHHGIIVEAFSEIWETFFCKSPRTQLDLEAS